MAKRKQTPDVLAELLGGQTSAGNGDLAPAGESSLARRREAAPSPASYEYALVTFQDYRGWRPRFINGYELRDWTNGPLIHEYLEAMGDDGWELAAAGGGERMYGSGDLHQLYFKRPKQD
jgi:hypothetical protein